MSNPQTKIDALKREFGFKLVRADRHRVWRSRDGIVFVEPSTPSDSYHGPANSLASLKRAIANAQRSEILAISEFQREQAALKIAGEAKKTAHAPGAAGSKKSSGTGFFYVDSSKPLSEMTPEALEKHRLESIAASLRQKQHEAARKKERDEERFVIRLFVSAVTEKAESEFAWFKAEADAALKFEAAAVRAIRRGLAGRKPNFRAPGGCCALGVYPANLAVIGETENHFRNIAKMKAAANSDSDDLEWDFAVLAGYRFPLGRETAKVLSPEWVLAQDEEKMNAAIGTCWAKSIEEVPTRIRKTWTAIKDYVRQNTLELATMVESEIPENLKNGIDLSEWLDEGDAIDAVLKHVLEVILHCRKELESRAARAQTEQAQPKRVADAEQRIALDVMYEPRGPLDGAIFAARKMREDVAAMQATLRDFEKLIRKI